MASEICIRECLTVLRLMKGDKWEPSHVPFYSAVLSPWPDEQARAVVEHCANTMTFRPSRAELLAAAVASDGRPGVEEAWAALTWDEGVTIVMTEEMSLAQGAAYALYYDDHVAARMAFKEKYSELVREARQAGKPIEWNVSLGQDRDGRAEPIRRAIEQGKLVEAKVQYLLPPGGSREPIQRLEWIEGPKPPQSECWRT